VYEGEKEDDVCESDFCMGTGDAIQLMLGREVNVER
jgi:hypothetical protein